MKQVSSPSLGLLDTRYLQILNNLSDLNNASTARTNLGVAIGSDVQAWDANLDQIAALAPTDNNFIVGTGSAWALETPSSARTSLGLVADRCSYHLLRSPHPKDDRRQYNQ